MARKPPGLFITGCDTGVGKTYITALIARALRREGYSVGVYKPVATGCRKHRGRWISDDAKALWLAAGRPATLERVCPQIFAAPLAPHLAAAEENRRVDAALLRAGLRYWQARSDIVLVEGIGGLMSPLTDDQYNADLAGDLGYPLVVIVQNQIGAINRALLTLIAASTFKEGLPVAGIVLNQTSPKATDDPSLATNAAELARQAVCPVLAEVRFGATRLATVAWDALARQL